LHRGDLAFLREGAAGTVTVRRIDGSLVMAIDGKVDATDRGGDLLTEKLLAHLPLHLLNHPRTVCVIGLASGVTAGAALTYPIDRLDVVEVSREVVQASHLFDGVNGKPLEEPRTHLIVNDGRNHLALTGRQYDVILSEPSNPWISGMNSLFTREFFRLARRRLNPGGVLAQWFHLYNMPPEDLRSLLRAFTDVFPSAVLWQLNDGDVLLTGAIDPEARDASPKNMPPRAAADLFQAGVAEPALLSTLYVMRGSDLARFAGDAEANTDDRAVLEFHGQRDLNAQTDRANARELTAAPKQMDTPRAVRAAWEQMTAERWAERGRMFEKAESYRLAFQSYQQAAGLQAANAEALAGMMRSARSPEERSAAGTLESRTQEALAAARAGEVNRAETILRAVQQAYAGEPEAHFNYGLFCLERARYDDAIRGFAAAIAVNHSYLPAYEGTAEAYLRKRDLSSAAEWSRRILQIDPSHAIARETLAGIEKTRSARDAAR
jgi:spermidine synthase